MGFLTGAKLAMAMAMARMANATGTLSIHSNAFRGVVRKSSLRMRSQNSHHTGNGEQEMFRRRNGGFYDVRKRSVFP